MWTGGFLSLYDKKSFSLGLVGGQVGRPGRHGKVVFSRL